jgi:hypothetical protein
MQGTPTNGLRGRVEKRLWGATFDNKEIDGISRDEAEAALNYSWDSPSTASRALQLGRDYHQSVSSTQDSYGSVEGSHDMARVAQKRNKNRKRDSH